MEPAPSLVLLSEVVGFWLVLQQTPAAVIEAPPEDVINPPDEAEVAVIFETEVIDTTGAVLIASFLQLKIKENSNPAISIP